MSIFVSDFDGAVTRYGLFDRYLLNKVEVSVSVHANPGVFDPERGLQMSLPEHSPP